MLVGRTGPRPSRRRGRPFLIFVFGPKHRVKARSPALPPHLLIARRCARRARRRPRCKMTRAAAARRARAGAFGTVVAGARRWPSTNYSAPTGAASRTPCAARRRAGRSRTRAWRGPAQLFAGRGALSCLLQCCAAVLPRPVNLRQSAIRARAISRRSESCCNVLIAAVTALRDGCKLVAGRCREACA